MSRLHLTLVMVLLCAAASGCGDRKECGVPERSLTIAELDSALALARCQRLVVTEQATVSLEGSERSLRVTAHPRPGDARHLDLMLEVLEGGDVAVRGGPWPVVDGGFAQVSVPWGGAVRVDVQKLPAGLIRLLVTERIGNSTT